jgi:hypothetical protein
MRQLYFALSGLCFAIAMWLGLMAVLLPRVHPPYTPQYESFREIQQHRAATQPKNRVYNWPKFVGQVSKQQSVLDFPFNFILGLAMLFAVVGRLFLNARSRRSGSAG